MRQRNGRRKRATSPTKLALASPNTHNVAQEMDNLKLFASIQAYQKVTGLSLDKSSLGFKGEARGATLADATAIESLYQFLRAAGVFHSTARCAARTMVLELQVRSVQSLTSYRDKEHAQEFFSRAGLSTEDVDDVISALAALNDADMR